MFCGMILLGALWVTPVVFWIRLSWQRELGDNHSIVLLVALGHALLLSFVWGMAPDFRARPMAELMISEHVVLAVAALLMHGVRWAVQRGRSLEPDEWRESSEIKSLSQYSMPLLLVVTTAVGLTMTLGRLLNSRGTAWFAVGIGSAAVSYGGSLIGKRWPRPWTLAAAWAVSLGAASVVLQMWGGNGTAPPAPTASIFIITVSVFWVAVKSGIVCIVQAAIERAKQDDRPQRRSPPESSQSSS